MTTNYDDTARCCNKNDDESDAIQPFEWLTNFTSLSPYLSRSFLFNDDRNDLDKSNRTALHVGCGSSSLGEGLVQFLGYNYVLNIDRDKDTLDKMKHRWLLKHDLVQGQSDGSSCENRMKMDWKCIDFFFHEEGSDVDEGSNNINDDFFDLVVDKSTLDCALCSDEGATGLLLYVYQRLHPIHGVYVLVSFHPVELIQPLLQNCPGTNWAVEHYVINRQLDEKDEMPLALSTTIGREYTYTSDIKEKEKTDIKNDVDIPNDKSNVTANPHSSSTVNVFICRRQHKGQDNMNNYSVKLNRGDVRDHVHEINDEWFQTHHPLLTRVREKELYQSFQNNITLPLEKCYQVLFTDAEREHLTMEHFLEDWNAFLQMHPEKTTSLLSKSESNEKEKLICSIANGMNYEIAVQFLSEMQ